jgi:putative inorganic carbon (HCO3(-)) transporter
MRDLVFTAFILGALPFAFLHPWIGVMLWTWVSTMSPHRLTFGFAYDQSWAAIIAGVTLVGMLVTSDRKSFPITPITILLCMIPLWMTVTTLFAFQPDGAWVMWNKVGKIYLMLLVTLALLNTRRHIELLVWITVGSIAYFGIKGGIFTLTTGGGERVYGPEGSYIEENNALAVATIMCIPLLNWVRMTVERRWVSFLMLAAMVLCAFSALGSHSRGALLAIVPMAALLWWRGKNKFLGMIVIGAVAVALVAFMPDEWEARMSTIETHEDGSAQGRLNAWAMALNLVKDRPIVGGGFDVFGPAAFARWAPDLGVQGAHSIYFQMLGEHGYPGLVMYLVLGLMVWLLASWIRKHAQDHPDLKWAYWLASMSQVSFIGFAVGGAFLNLAYWDMPLNLVVALVLTRVLMEADLVKQKSVGPRRDANGRLISQPRPPDTASRQPVS